MATIQDIKQRAQQVKDATQIGENTANRVGGVLVDLADHLEQDENQLSSLYPADAVPTPGSVKPVQSGGVFREVAEQIMTQFGGRFGVKRTSDYSTTTQTKAYFDTIVDGQTTIVSRNSAKNAVAYTTIPMKKGTVIHFTGYSSVNRAQYYGASPSLPGGSIIGMTINNAYVFAANGNHDDYYIMPYDGHFFYAWYGENWSDRGFEIVEPTDEILAMIDDLEGTINRISRLLSSEITAYTEYKYGMNTNGKFGTDGNTYKHGCIAVEEGEQFLIESNSGNTNYAFVTSDTCSAGRNIPLVVGTSVINIPYNTSVVVTIPEGVSYLAFNSKTGFNTKIYKYLEIDEYPTGVFAEFAKLDGLSLTLDKLYVSTKSGSFNTLYANGNEQEHSPVTYTFGNNSLVLVLSERNQIEMRQNLSAVLNTDVILLAYSLSKGCFYGGLLYYTLPIIEVGDFDLMGYPTSSIIINPSNVWQDASFQDAIQALVPIVSGNSYTIKTSNNKGVMAVLRDNNIVIGDTPNFSSEFNGRKLLPENSIYTFTAPTDGAYLYIVLRNTSGYTNVKVYSSLPIEKALKSLTERVEDLEDGKNPNKVEIKEVNGSRIDLTPLEVFVDEDGWELPSKLEVLNVQKKSNQMLNIVWTPQADIEYDASGHRFVGGVAVTGLPYSSVKEIDKYIGFDVSLLTFMTAINNPYSLVYTENINRNSSRSVWGNVYHGVDNCGMYFGTVCSVLTGYATAQKVQWPTSEDRWCANVRGNLTKIFNQSAQGLRVGDIYWMEGHNRLIVGVKRNTNGFVTNVLASEAWIPKIRMTNKTASSFNSGMVSENAIIYRNTELYRNDYAASPFVAVDGEVITPYIYNDDICAFAGDKATFREGDLVVINYNLKNTNSAWTAIEVYKNDVLLNTYQIANIDQSELPEGQRNHALKLGTSLTYGKYKARLTDGTNFSDYTEWEVLQTNVAFTKENEIHHISYVSANGNPLSFTICNQSGTVYAHNELSEEEASAGYIDIDLVKFNREQYPNKPFSGNMYLKIHFEGRFGRVTNEPFVIDI